MELKVLKNIQVELEFFEWNSSSWNSRFNKIFFFFKFSVCYNLIVEKSSFKLKLDFEKIELQNMDISLISLGNEAKRCIFCAKRAFAHFSLSMKARLGWICNIKFNTLSLKWEIVNYGIMLVLQQSSQLLL